MIFLQRTCQTITSISLINNLNFLNERNNETQEEIIRNIG